MPSYGTRPTEPAHWRRYKEVGTWDDVQDEIPHLIASGIVSVLFGNPAAGFAFHAGMHNFGSDTSMYESSNSRGGGGPSALTQSPPSSPRRPQVRGSPQDGKSVAPARLSKRGSRHGRKSCPKGHYWSFTEKKCVKSKFR